MNQVDVVIIGGGPAGLGAALAADKKQVKVVLIEREAQLGGILKQCIHDGFGLIRYREKLSGPEYGDCDIKRLAQSQVQVMLQTFVKGVERCEEGFCLTLITKRGIQRVLAKTLVLATGCRERTARQIGIHGTRPVGVYTAGTAQYFVNRMGVLPCKTCVVLGSGDIGLIMARRLTLEGAKVLGVYEVKEEPSGLMRNVHQCLKDFEIPLYLSHTVTQVFGEKRVSGVEVAQVDKYYKPIEGTQKRIACDGVILSVGLIPENEVAESLGVEIDPRTKGPLVDQYLMTSVEGVFCCGNALHVNDLVDYVSEGGFAAGESAAGYVKSKRYYQPIVYGAGFGYGVPQKVDYATASREIVCYFRVAQTMKNVTLIVTQQGKELVRKKYPLVRPSEMERLKLRLSANEAKIVSPIVFEWVGESNG